MNQLLVSTFSCTYQEYKQQLSERFITIHKDSITCFEFAKVSDHKAFLMLEMTDPEKFISEIEASDWAEEWDKKNNVKDIGYQLKYVGRT
jgi:hypothetical protein